MSNCDIRIDTTTTVCRYPNFLHSRDGSSSGCSYRWKRRARESCRYDHSVTGSVRVRLIIISESRAMDGLIGENLLMDPVIALCNDAVAARAR